MPANIKLTYNGTGTSPLFLSDVQDTTSGPRGLKLPAKSWMVLKYAGDIVASYSSGTIDQFVTRGLLIAELTDEPLQPTCRINAPSGPAGGGLSGTYPNPTAVGLNISGQVKGSVLYFDGTNWTQLPPGTAGFALTTNGAGADPTWVATGGSGSIPLALEMELEFKVANLSNFKTLGYTGDDLTLIEIWTTPGMLTKLFSKVFTYNVDGDLTQTVLTRVSDAFTLTRVYAYNVGGDLISVTSS